MTQKKFISSLLKKHPDAVVIGSLGTICYDLKEIEHKKKILITGAMGCAMGVGLGYALSSNEQVIVIIGDGSYLMKMGSVSTIMAYKPENLKVYIMNNGVYASTGGQKINNIPRAPKSHFRICRVD